MEAKKYNLGLVSISFRNNTPKEVIEAVANAGLSYIEWGSDVHAPCNDIGRLEEIAALQKEYGVACSSYGTYFRLGETPIEELNDYIAAAKILGTDILRLWGGRKCSLDMTEEEKAVFIDSCHKAAEIAEAQGVILCLECHQRTYTERLEDTLFIMSEVNSPNFKMYWQPFQTKSIEENIACAKAISDMTYVVHVFQWKGKEKFSLEKGIDEWKQYLSQIPAPRTLLLEFMPDGKISTLPKEAAALKSIVGE